MKKLRFLTYSWMIISLFLMTACPPYTTGPYFVYYYGNEATSGTEPEDSKAYQTGEKAVVLEPGSLEKKEFAFEGWRQYNYRPLYKPGETITIDYDHIYLYAVWKLIGNAFRYTILSGEITITGYEGFVGAELITIPETIEDKPVTRIGDDAFRKLYIGKVMLPEGLISIGSNAFSHNYLSEISIPDTVTAIESIAFQNNTLTSLDLGNNLVSIGDYAFDENDIAYLLLPDTVQSIGAGAFNQNPINLIKIGRDVTIKNDSSLGMHGASFRQYYDEQGKQEGVYEYHRGSWERDADL
jgi:hypothetical protein